MQEELCKQFKFRPLGKSPKTSLVPGSCHIRVLATRFAITIELTLLQFSQFSCSYIIKVQFLQILLRRCLILLFIA